jgi:hypothetical protein
VWAAMISQVQRSAACAVRTFGTVQPRVCLTRAEPPGHFDRQIGQDEREADDVVTGVHDDRDVRITLVPVPGVGDPADDVAELGGGDGGGVVGRAQADRVEDRGPGATTGLQRGDEGVRLARDELRGGLGTPVDVAEQPFRAGRCIRAKPWRDIDRKDDAPARRPG